MSLFVTLMIGGWTTAIAVIGFCALKESCQLLRIHKRIGLWLEDSTARVRRPEEGLQPERENAF
jgi:hypothetical protein